MIDCCVVWFRLHGAFQGSFYKITFEQWSFVVGGEWFHLMKEWAKRVEDPIEQIMRKSDLQSKAPESKAFKLNF